MTFANTFTPMADHLRAEYGITDKLTTSQLKLGINGLHAHNYVADGLSFDSTNVKSGEWKAIQGITIDSWNALSGKTVAISMDVTWSNYKTVNNQSNRLGFEYGIHYSKSATEWVGLWLGPTTESGSKHCVTIMKLPNDTATSWEEGFFYNQVNSDCKFTVTNIKIVENPMGGVVPTNLLAGSIDLKNLLYGQVMDGLSAKNNLLTWKAGIVDNMNDLLHVAKIKLKQGHHYELSFVAIGQGTVATYVYTYDNGQDNHSKYSLNNDWQIYSYSVVPPKEDVTVSFGFRSYDKSTYGMATDFKLIDLTE